MKWYHVTCDDAGPHREWEIEAPDMDEALSYATTILRTDWQGPAHLVVSRWRDLPAVTTRLERLETLAKLVESWRRECSLPGNIVVASVALDYDSKSGKVGG